MVSQYSMNEDDKDDEDTYIDDDYKAPSLNVASINLIAGGNDYILKLEHALQAEFKITEGTESAALSNMTAESAVITLK